MAGTTQQDEAEKARILLGLLESVERDGAQSQRSLASELGIALGLVNAYLKRCAKKGLIKMKGAPARRYAYYLTPQGFAEKSRLTVEYLSYSFSFFRRARADCSAAFARAKARNWRRIVLAGASDLAEIATICALESGIEIAAVVEPSSKVGQIVGVPVVASFEAVTADVDGVMVTDVRNAREVFAAASARFGRERVLVPSLLGIREADDVEAA
jgi:predicted transcriptional regulator